MSERRLNSIIVYSHPGYGKTTSVAMAVPNALWVVTRKRNLDAYRDFLIKEPERAAELNLKPIESVVEVPVKEIAKTGWGDVLLQREHIRSEMG